METEGSLKRRAVMVITKTFSWHVQTYCTINIKNILLLLCTPVVLIYNSELGLIISSEFFSHKETLEEALFTSSSFIYLFYLGNFF